MVFMDFVQKIFYFHEKFIKDKKEVVVKMPIAYSWYAYNNWYEAKIIKCEIER